MEEIKTFVIAEDDHIRIDAVIGEISEDLQLLERGISFKITNIISSLMEASTTAWLQNVVKTDIVPFYLKIHSDSNKEQWVRILKSAFGNNYPWTLIIAKVSAEVDKFIRSRKQDFLASEIEAKQCTWLLEPFIQEDVINTIFGMGSSGKTLLALYFAKEICGIKTEGKVLFVDFEDTQGGWKDKLQKICSIGDMGVDLDRFVYFQSEQIPVTEQVEKIKSTIKKHNVMLTIVDSASLATGESTSDEKSAIRLVSALKVLQTTTLLIAHQRKNDGDRTPIGSIQYENQSRNVWNVKGTPDQTDNSVIHIAMTHTKANNTYLRREPLGYRINYNVDRISITRESAQNYFEDKYSIKQRIQKLLRDEGEFNTKDIADNLGISSNTANKNLSEGKRSGLFQNINGIWSIISSNP